jgi:hypothetical protein
LFNEIPVPALVPPHEPVYHFHFAPDPNVPPLNVRVIDWPLHITEGFAATDPGATDNWFTVTITLAHAVVLHNPSALTQYVVAIVGEITGLIPEVENNPPQVPVYQFQIAEVPAAPPENPSVDDWPLQIDIGEAFAETGVVEFVLIVTVTDVLDILEQARR